MPTQPPAIYVDVDDTLIRTFGTKRIPIPATVALVKALRLKGALLYCWSRGGGAYAREVAEQLGIVDCFEAFLPKPQLLLDDAGVERWSAVELHPAQCASMTVDEVLSRVAS